MRLIIALLLLSFQVFSSSVTNNYSVGKTLSVSGGKVTSLNKVDGSFESDTTGWSASVGTIVQTASTEIEGSFVGTWAGTGTGTLDFQWTATGSGTFEGSTFYKSLDSDIQICAVVSSTETGCQTIGAAPTAKPVSAVADSVLSSSWYLRLKHTGSDSFSVVVDDAKIQRWTPQYVQTATGTNIIQIWQDGIGDWSTSASITIGATEVAPTKGTLVVDEVIWERNNGNLSAIYNYQQSSAGTGGSGYYLLSLPNGLKFGPKVRLYTGAALYTSGQSGDIPKSMLNAIVLLGSGDGNGYFASGAGYIIPYDETRFRVIFSYKNGISASTVNTYWWGTGGDSNMTLNQLASMAVSIRMTDVPIQGWSNYPYTLLVPSARVAYLKNVQSSGTAGSAATSGAWRTITLNTVTGDSSIVSLSSNQFTLQAGKYVIDGGYSVYRGDIVKAKIRNITASSDSIIGENIYSASGGADGAIVPFDGPIELTSATTFELQGRVETSTTFGIASGYGVDEVYAKVKITKLD